MKSVDALRKWADGLRGIWLDPNDHSIIVTTCDDMVPSMDCVSLREYVNGILDEIECEVDDMWHLLTIDAKPMTDENMAESGWVRLPVDADGEPIHVGDVMAYADNTKPMEVVALVPPSVVIVDDGPRYADMCRHHHAPTVEDVLREFIDSWADTEGREDERRVMDEYAAKLMLKED